MRESNQGGRCRACGIKLVDWDRVHKRDLADIGHTFEALKYELIRHHYWHVDIDQRAINHALRKGSIKMKAATENRLRKSVGAAQPIRDGYQTPREGNVIYYAQHATASCCRKCMEEWHGIPLGQELTDDQIAYLTNLAMLYIEERLPNLAPAGVNIPPMRQVKAGAEADARRGTQHGESH